MLWKCGSKSTYSSAQTSVPDQAHRLPQSSTSSCTCGCICIYKSYSIIPVVPARGGAEVALKIYIRPFSSIELACAVRQRSTCVRAVCETDVLFHMSHFTLDSLHTRHYTLHTALFTLHSSHCTLHPSQSTLHTSLHASHCTLHTSHFTLHTSHFTLHTSHCTLHAPHFTLHTSHSTLHLI